MADQRTIEAVRIVDPTTPTQQLAIDATGRIGVNQGTGNAATSPWSVSGTVSISNTPTVNQGTSPWIVSGGVSVGAPLPPGTNSIGTVGLNAGTTVIGKVQQDIGNAGTSPWAVSGNVSISNTPSVNQGTSPWITSGGVSIGSPLPPGGNNIGIVNVQGTVAAGVSVATVNPVVVGLNTSGARAEFLTSAPSTRSTSGGALLGVGIQVYDSVGNLYRDALTGRSASGTIGSSILGVANLGYDGSNNWFPLQLDGSQNLKVSLQTALPAGSSVNQGTGNAGGSPWAISGTVTALSSVSPTATRTSVAAATGSTTVLAANTARIGATVFNDSTMSLFLALGSSASTTNFTAKLNPQDYYEVPFSYTGILTGVWNVALGNARVTELT